MKHAQIKMLLAGAGLMGKTHLEVARKLGTVKYVGVVDVKEQLGRKLAASFGLPAYADPQAAIDATRPDAVDLCIPTPWHRPMVAICAARGVHVLCEKPIALTGADARAIRTMATKAGIRVMIAHVLRFWPEYAFTVAAARQGLFGKIRTVECRRLSAPPGWNSWMMRPGLGDGAVVDLQIHDMDFILQLLGRPRTILASGTQANGAFNAVVNRLEYSSGAVVESKASFIMPPSYPFRMTFAIEFEKGVIDMDSWRKKGQRLRVYPARGKSTCPKLEQLDPYGAEIDYFARRLRDGKPFARAPLAESITALDMCLASRKSCTTGRSICFK